MGPSEASLRFLEAQVGPSEARLRFLEEVPPFPRFRGNFEYKNTGLEKPQTLHDTKTRASKNLKPHTIQKHRPLKTLNSAGCVFMTKTHANQKSYLKTSTIMVYKQSFLNIILFFGMFFRFCNLLYMSF